MLKRYLGRMRGGGKAPAMHSTSWILWSWLGAFLSILAVAWVHRFMPLSSSDKVLLIGSFGASAVLIYGTPHVPYAQPRNLIGGHLVSALTGVAISLYLPLPLELNAALAVATAIVAMHLSKTLHPPGGATALIAVIGSERIQNLGFDYVWQPVLSGALIMLLVALLVNNLSADDARHYPKYWW